MENQSESRPLTFTDTTVRPPNSDEFSPWNSKGFVRPVKENPTNSLNNIFGAIVNDPRMCFIMQLIVSMASLPHLGFCSAKNMKDNLETLLKAYGAVVHYTNLSGAIYHDEEELKPVLKSGLFDQVSSEDVTALVKEGEQMCEKTFDEAIKEDPSIRTNRYHFFSLNTTFQNYVTRNQELMQRVMPVVYACRFVMEELEMTIPGILFDESLGSANFVIDMFHAPRMAVPYISWDSSATAKACMAIQLYKQNNDQARHDKCRITDVFDHFQFMTGLIHGDTKALDKFREFIGTDGLNVYETMDILLIYNKLILDSAFDIGVVNCLKFAIDDYSTNPHFMAYRPHTVVEGLPKGIVTEELVNQVRSGQEFLLPPVLIPVCAPFNCKYIVLAMYLRDQGIAFHPYSSVKELDDIFTEKCSSSELDEEYQLPESIRIRLAAKANGDTPKPSSETSRSKPRTRRGRRRPLRPQPTQSVEAN